MKAGQLAGSSVALAGEESLGDGQVVSEQEEGVELQRPVGVNPVVHGGKVGGPVWGRTFSVSPEHSVEHNTVSQSALSLY